MVKSKSKSLLDAFLGAPGTDTLKKAASLLENTLPEKLEGVVSIDQPIDQPNGISINSSINPTTDQQAKQSIERPDDSSLVHPPDTPTNQPIDQPIDPIIPQSHDRPIILRENEALLYYALNYNSGCFTTVRRIAQKLDKSEHTLRKCLKRLKTMGLIVYQRTNVRGQQGIKIRTKSASINILGNMDRVKLLLKDLPLIEIPIHTTKDNLLAGQLTNQVTTQLTGQSAGKVYGQLQYSSSSGDRYTTTYRRLANFFTSDPRSLYWKDKGLTAKQIENWVKETQMSVEDIIQSLEHCWFEMVHLRKEEEKDIRDVLSWFYKTVRKAGFYPPPKGFKPYEEVRAEEMAKARKKRETAIEKLQEEARKEYELKKETEFWEIMADHESEKYKRCFEKLNKFEKQLKGGPTFEKAMRKAFDELFLGEG